MEKKRVTVGTVKEMKAEGKPIAMLTAYDYSMAKLLDEAGVDMLLVGDSLGNVVLGYDSTIPVTVEDMIHHGAAVCRGTKRAMVVVDMPFLSYQVSLEDAVRNAGRIFKATGAQAVKLEGGTEMAETVAAIVRAGIPVVGHIGLTPQSVHQLGGFKVQGKDVQAAHKLLADAKALEAAGAFAVVLECVPATLAKLVTERIGIATIGIGAGCDCDGQVLVISDMLGMYGGFTPKFVRKFAELQTPMQTAVRAYCDAVVAREFPAQAHAFAIADDVLEKLY